jgi:hypothetical protein
MLVIVLAFFFAEGGCGGGGGSSSGSSGSGETGTLSLGLTDAATDKYEAVYVTIEEVSVKPENGSWETVSTPMDTYNLLELVNGVIENLGETTVPAGNYEQMRLLIGEQKLTDENIFGDEHEFANYIILNGETQQRKLKIPSGAQTGIKLVSPFNVSAHGTTELILDFDADRSVIQAGKSGLWLLKPTIRILNSVEKVTLTGEIGSSNETDMNGTLVSVQILNDQSIKETNEVQVLGASVSQGLEGSENATYTLYTEPGNQNLVAYKQGFLPGVHIVNPDPGATLVRNFTLQNATMGVINGTVEVSGDDLSEDDYVALSFRHQLESIGSGDVTWIELKNQRQNIEEDEVEEDNGREIFLWSFNATLPDMSESIGNYRVVATLFESDYDDDDEVRGNPFGDRDDRFDRDDDDDDVDDKTRILDEQAFNATLGDELVFNLEKGDD